MRALRIEAVGALAVREVPDPVPAPGEAVVDIRAAALNHRDVWIKLGQYAGLKYPCIPGSDGAGVVSSVGARRRPVVGGPRGGHQPGPRLGPVRGRAGARLFDPRASPRRDARGADLGPGGPAYPEARPPGLGGGRGAAARRAHRLAGLCSAGRGWRPASACLSRASAGASRSSRSSSRWRRAGRPGSPPGSDDKIARAVALGARGGFRYDRDGWAAAPPVGRASLTSSSTAPAGRDSAASSTSPRPGGRIVFFGATRGNAPEVASAQDLLAPDLAPWATMGSPADWAAMTDFVSPPRLRPVVSDIFPLGRGARRRSSSWSAAASSARSSSSTELVVKPAAGAVIPAWRGPARRCLFGREHEVPTPGSTPASSPGEVASASGR